MTTNGSTRRVAELPSVLFLCIHNAGRSQMALGWFKHLAGGRAVVWSGGSEPAKQINPSAVAAMEEVGIDITGEYPKPWTDEGVRAADVVITMGCGDACPFYPGKRYEDWALDGHRFQVSICDWRHLLPGSTPPRPRPRRDRIRNAKRILGDARFFGAPGRCASTSPCGHEARPIGSGLLG